MTTKEVARLSFNLDCYFCLQLSVRAPPLLLLLSLHLLWLKRSWRRRQMPSLKNTSTLMTWRYNHDTLYTRIRHWIPLNYVHVKQKIHSDGLCLSSASVGGAAVCGRAQQCLAAVRVCAERRGVDAGAQHNCKRAHGPLAAPTYKGRDIAHTAVLQRVSAEQETPHNGWLLLVLLFYLQVHCCRPMVCVESDTKCFLFFGVAG